jgi:hypothetical protein
LDGSEYISCHHYIVWDPLGLHTIGLSPANQRGGTTGDINLLLLLLVSVNRETTYKPTTKNNVTIEGKGKTHRQANY